MLITQAFLVLLIIGLGFSNPAKQPLLVAFLAFMIAFFSASQDIAIDAFRTELLASEERGAGASVSNFGYRLAMIVSGAIALILADHLPWSQVYALMALLVGIGILASFFADEPAVEIRPPLSIRDAVMHPLTQFFQRKGAILILIFILIYKIDIVMAVALMTKFMMELGFTKTEIGAVTKTVGMISAIVGSLCGGALYARLGLKRSLWYFGIIQGFSTLSFAVLAEVGKNSLVMAGAVGFENFCAGLATAPFIALLMSLCDKRYTATQYALLSSFAAVSRVIAGAPTGYLVLAMGWTPFFILCALTAIPGLLMIHLFYDSWEIEKGA